MTQPRGRKITKADVVAGIRLGHLDDAFADIAKAYVQRIRERGGTLAWKIELGDLVVTEEDMELGDYRDVAARCATVHPLTGELVRTSWREIDPVDNMEHLVEVLVIHKARRDSSTLAEARDKIESANVLADLRVSQYEVSLPLGSTTTTL